MGRIISLFGLEVVIVMLGFRYLSVLLFFFISVVSTIQQSFAHPHVFAEARLEIQSDMWGEIVEFRHVWRFDEFFSASVLLDFDANKNLQLDSDELIKIGQIVHESLAEFDYYMHVTLEGERIDMLAPSVMVADYVDNQLLFIFAMRPKNALKLNGKISAGVYDPTFYTAMEFVDDNDLVFIGPHANKCQTSVIRPDPDEVIAQNQGRLTAAFYDDTEINDLSQLFATRIELLCG